MTYHIQMIEKLSRFEQTDAVAIRIIWHKGQLAKHGIFAI